jgi:hypothetical protein
MTLAGVSFWGVIFEDIRNGERIRKRLRVR